MAYRMTATKPANSGYSVSPIGTYVRSGEIMKATLTGLTLAQAYAWAKFYNEEMWDVVIDGPGDIVRFPHS